MPWRRGRLIGWRQLLFDSLALSAWKEAGPNRWALRVNPSSGNLHPTEGYVLAGPVEGLSETPGLWHYRPTEHALERRADLSNEMWRRLAGRRSDEAVMLAISSIPWREAWKYGERAYRYCQHDAGHAIAAVAYAAAGLGWRVRMVDHWPAGTLATLLGTGDAPTQEAEHVDTLLLVGPGVDADDANRETPDLEDLTHHGQRIALSESHHPWPVIDEVAEAAARDEPGHADWTSLPSGEALDPCHADDADSRTMIHQRRSAVAMDGRTGLERDAFLRMMSRTAPAIRGGAVVPFGAFPWEPCVHLGVFVHRVADLTPGVYLLCRSQRGEAELRDAIQRDFAWEPIDGVAAPARLFLLQEADATDAAGTISCQQRIAADSTFSLGMLARFEPTLREQGAWMYPRLFWETGAIGQVLYLEAEACGVRATGIGCFFDDLMHDVLGLKDRAYQSLYHFTVGGPVDDDRLQTHPPYSHLSRPTASLPRAISPR